MAVTSKITRHSLAVDLLKGETKDTVVDSEGTIALARRALAIDTGKLLKDVWIINAIVVDADGAVYLGTSPNGDIIKYSNDKAEKIYPLETSSAQSLTAGADPNDPNSVTALPAIANEHVFAMAMDAAGRVLAAVSGDKCRLLRFGDKIETIFTPDPKEATYIFAITLDELGNIYLGTGPEGHIYRLNPFGRNPELVYDSRDRNILSLAIDADGSIYAGSDKRGLIYKINQTDSTATVLYDSEQSEITALVLDDDGNLYACATSAEAATEQLKFGSIARIASAGRAPKTSKKKDNSDETSTSKTLIIANTDEPDTVAPDAKGIEVMRGAPAKSAGHIYKIDRNGFVTDIFSEMAVFFSLASQNGQLLLGTGNNAQLFSIDPETEQKSVAYQDTTASQITSLAVSGEHVYLGTANPAKVIKLAASFAQQGSYTSDLIDAKQPARWGKLQIDADIPSVCNVLLSARSGNIKDPNDPTFSTWTPPVEMTGPAQLTCPLGRFCQYKLTLKTTEPDRTPVIREVAVAHVVPNLPPRLTSVTAARSKDEKNPGTFTVTYSAEDDNKDTLIYKIEFRKTGRANWIELKDELSATNFDFDSRTLEDGRYEVKVTADDRRSNTSTTALTGSRISEPFVIDNTAPKIERSALSVHNSDLTITLTVTDDYSAIGKVSYTIDSNKDWTATLPDDMVYDTTEENFTIVIEDLDAGEHVVALQISDDLGNTMYKTYDIKVPK